MIYSTQPFSVNGRAYHPPGRPVVVLDVAHNPHAAATLSQNLDNMGFHAYTYAVFGSMLDKDIDGVIAQIKGKIDHWCLTDLPLPRAATALQINDKLVEAGVVQNAEQSIQNFDSPEAAYTYAFNKAGENDRIVVFGSFLTVAGVMKARKLKSADSGRQSEIGTANTH